MKVITTEKLPIKMWLENIEDGALEQAKNLANLPFTFKHVAIMPDSHQGYGMPIGGVLATDGVIIPNAVGVDIGCGMCAVKTSVKSEDITKENLTAILGKIRELVPVGFSHQKDKQDATLLPNGQIGDKIHAEFENSLTQLGTLGGGNHFIEIQKGSDGFVWLMIHSGSRNLGYKVANAYNEDAIALNEKWKVSVPKEWQLAYLPLDSKEGLNYMVEMDYCVNFALANRKLMMERVKEAFISALPSANFDPMINIAHNYAREEIHFGKKVIVHRKGATRADNGLVGIIPGSMGTASYIVAGLGNPESFQSCSHGAGRKMGRGQAIRTLNLEEEQKKMEGILGAPRTQDDLQEAPSAYKDVYEVMANQRDLVRVLIELKPLAVVKG